MLECEVTIIGAGPHALSLLSRILVDNSDKYEERPSNGQLFSKNVKGKYHPKVKDNPKLQRTPREITAYFQSNSKENPVLQKICVIDRHGCWMSQWARQFDVLGISHLRSTISVHPEAFDLNSLVAFAHDQKRSDEVCDITRDIRGSSFSGPFIIPSVKLFWDFCTHLVKRHRLQNIVKKGEVTEINCMNSSLGKHFQITLKDGSIIHSRKVVVSTGNMTIKQIPYWAENAYLERKWKTILHTSDLIQKSNVGGIDCQTKSSYPDQISDLEHRFQSHSLDLNLNIAFPDHFNVKDKKVLIVGGGLSSGHVTIKAALLGAKKVDLVCRSALKIRQFDLDLDWIGRNRFIKLAQFYSVDSFEERFDIIRSCRRGGSITPAVHQQLKQLEEDEILDVYEETEVWGCNVIKDPDGSHHWEVELSNGSSLQVHHIWLATGSVVDVAKDPLFTQVLKSLPLDVVGGLPALTENLEWGDGSNLYVMGAYSGLQLGPDALNLAGARNGASRIAFQLKRYLKKRQLEDKDHDVTG